MKNHKKIGLVHLFFDKKNADAIRTLKFARWLKNAGFRPIIITTSNAKIRKSKDYDIIFLKGPSTPKLVAPFLLSLTLTKTLLKEHIEYCFVFIVGAATAIILSKLLLRNQLKLIYDIQGVLVEEIDILWHYPPILTFFMKNLFNLVERFCLKKSEYVTAHNHLVTRFYRKKYPFLKHPILEFSNAPIISNLSIKSKVYREVESFINQRRSVVFIGRNQNWQGIQNLVAALAPYHNPNLCFIIIGFKYSDFGSYDEKMILNYENLPQTEVYNILPLFTAGIIPRDKNVVTYVASPTKFFEYFASGLLIISTNVGEIAHLVKKYDLGYIVKSNDFSSIFDTVAQLSNQQLTEKKQQKIQLYRNIFNAQKYIHQIKKMFP